MQVRIIGSAEMVHKSGLADGPLWTVDPEKPIGDEAQIDELRRMFGVPGVRLWNVANGMRSDEIMQGRTPAQNAMTNQLWVEPHSEGTMHPTAMLPMHPALGGFRHPHMVFIRVVSKWTQRGQRKHRVLLLTTKSIYFAHPEGHTSRWLRFAELIEAIILPDGEGDIVLLKNVAPEHDLMFQLIDHHHNLPLHTTSAELAFILNKSGVKIVPWTGTSAELQNQARLMKQKGYINPLNKLRALQKAPLTSISASPDRFSSRRQSALSPYLAERDRERGEEQLREEEIERGRLQEREWEREREVEREREREREREEQQSPIKELIEKQEGEINSLKENFEVLKESENEKRHNMQTEMDKLKQQNLDLAKTVLASASAALGGGLTASPPIMPQRQYEQPVQVPVLPLPISFQGLSSPAAPEPVRGIKKAAFVMVSHSGELQGVVSSFNAVHSFVSALGTQSTRMLRDDGFDLTCETPTKPNILAAINWLVENLRTGEAVMLALLCPSKNDAWVAADNNVITIDEIHAHLLSRIPQGAKLTILVDTLPSSPGPSLQFGLMKTSSSVQTLTKNSGDKVYNVLGDVTVLGGAADSNQKISSGQLAGILSQAYVKAMMKLPMSCEALLTTVYHTLCEGAPSPIFPVLMSNMRPRPEGAVTLTCPPTSPEAPPSPSPMQDHALPPKQLQASLPQLPVPLMGPFVAVNSRCTVEPPPLQSQDPEYWRNMVCHAFLVPTAFNAPHVSVSSSHSGKELRLNKDYVSAFVQQWPLKHSLVITVNMTGTVGQTEVRRRFQASEAVWQHIKLKINELLGQRAVQRLMYPHSKDAKRTDNFYIVVEGCVVPEEPISCNDEDWLQAVLSWEVDNGFSFTKTSLPVPLMPPFELDEVRNGDPYDAKVVEYLKAELSGENETAAKSVSFQYDSDLIRNLMFHARLMPTARQPPFFVVEDSQMSHPVMVNQQFLMKYVKAWGEINPHLIWVHNADTCTLIAKCRVTPEFWRFCCTRGSALQATMGDGNVLSTKDANGKAVCRLAMHKLAITSSSTPETLQLWDGVWCTVVAEWQANLPRADLPWSPSRTMRRTSPPQAPYSPLPPPGPFTPGTYNF